MRRKMMAKFHGVDYTNNQYITMKTQLEEGIYTFQVKVEKEGLVLDVFLHVGDEDEHVITKTAWYEDIGLLKTKGNINFFKDAGGFLDKNEERKDE
jgi:hypothetical protein